MLDLSVLTNSDGSAAVPTGAKAVSVILEVYSPTPGNRIYVSSVSNNTMSCACRTQVANTFLDVSYTVPLLTDRTLWYSMTAANTWVHAAIKIIGVFY